MLKQLIERHIGHEITVVQYQVYLEIYECKAKARINKNKKTYWKDLIVLSDRLSNRTSNTH